MKKYILLIAVLIIIPFILSSCNVTIITTDPHVHTYEEHLGLIHERMNEGVTTYYTCSECGAYFDKDYKRIQAFNKNANVKDWDESCPFFSHDIELYYYDGFEEEDDEAYEFLYNEILEQEVDIDQIIDDFNYWFNVYYTYLYDFEIYNTLTYLYFDEEVGYNPEYYDLSNKLYGLYIRSYDRYITLNRLFKGTIYEELYSSYYDYDNSAKSEDVIFDDLASDIALNYNDLDNLIENLTLYKKYRNAQAALYGYENYMDYAYSSIYKRSYLYEDLEDLFIGTKDYIITEGAKLVNEINTLKAEVESNPILLEEYNKLGAKFYDNDIISNFVNVVGGGILEQYNYIMNEGLYFISDKFTDYKTAYTSSFEDEDFIYFQQQFDDLDAFIHEFGHYAGENLNGYYSSSYDWLETTSQANEMMLFAYLYHIHPDSVVYKLKYLDMLDTFIGYNIFACAEIEMENYVFTTDDLNLEDVSAKWDSLCDEYGLKYKGQNKRWTYEMFRCTSYISSYVTSGYAVANLGLMALTDFDGALDVYRSIFEVTNSQSTNLLKVYDTLGIGNPFELDFYVDLGAELSDLLD